jgi:Asp-tRNA(Asn)/Glu-tRNA(Gln) amidotransferase C subunit
MIDKETVLKVAYLARLELSEEEVEIFAKQLGIFWNLSTK